MHTWPGAEYVAEEEKIAEKEMFEKTFWEVSEKNKGRAGTATADAIPET